MPKRASLDEDGKERDKQDEDILSKAIAYCWGDDFLNIFRRYFKKHAHKFEVMAEGKTEEHDLEYQELFNEYLGLFEGTLEEFIEREGSTNQEFYAACQQHQGTSDPQIRLFLDCLLASADYDSFFNVMKKEARRNLERRDERREDNDPPEEKGQEAPGSYK